MQRTATPRVGAARNAARGAAAPAAAARGCAAARPAAPSSRPAAARRRPQRLPLGAAAAQGASAAPSASAAAPPPPPQVVLTREAGKNGELAARLAARGVAVLEMPLVASAPGPDRARLVELLAADADAYDWVCLTSPEAAAVFAEAWRAAGRPAVRVAVVGDGTARALAAAGPDAAAALAPAFTPSVANAEHFAPELPAAAAGAAATRVLYPSSAKASTELQAGLAARGFDVLRLNTYDTLPVEALDPGALAAARRAAVVAVASPSAVRAWVCFAGPEAAARVAVAAIGGTSARAARKLGLERVFFPEEPGIETFERAVLEALAAAAGA